MPSLRFLTRFLLLFAAVSVGEAGQYKDCHGEDACKDATIECNSSPCYVDCNGEKACSDTVIQGSAEIVLIRCRGGVACEGNAKVSPGDTNNGAKWQICCENGGDTCKGLNNGRMVRQNSACDPQKYFNSKCPSGSATSVKDTPNIFTCKGAPSPPTTAVPSEHSTSPSPVPHPAAVPAPAPELLRCDQVIPNHLPQMPASIIDMTNCTEGTIPPAIGNLVGVTTVNLANTQVSGIIPMGIGRLSKLTVLNLGGSKISGSIPSEIGYLSMLSVLDFSNMKLTGSTPLEISSLTSLKRVMFTGTVLEQPWPSFERIDEWGQPGPMPVAPPRRNAPSRPIKAPSTPVSAAPVDGIGGGGGEKHADAPSGGGGEDDDEPSPAPPPAPPPAPTPAPTPASPFCPPGSGMQTNAACQGLKKVCFWCNPGQYNNGTGEKPNYCKECSMGQYGDKPGLVQCKNCSTGTYGPVKQSISSETCFPCPVGKYGDQQGQTSTKGCKPCPSNTFTPGLGQKNISSCITCQLGMYQDEAGQGSCKPASCPLGQWGSAPPHCTNCSAGKYGPSAGAGDPEKCLDCPEGRFGKQVGAKTIKHCIFCPKGTFGNLTGLTSDDCTGNCPSGQYGPMKGMTECLECSPGTFHHAGVSNGSRHDSCDACKAGHYQDKQAAMDCKPCPSGKYSEREARASANDCTALPAGYLCQKEGLSYYKGPAVTCDINYVKDAGGTCERCAPGTTASTDHSHCVIDLTIILSIAGTLVSLLIPVAFLIRRRIQRRRKYTVVTVGRRQRGCCARKWQLHFPRRSRFSRLDITEGVKLGNGAFGEVNRGTLQVGKAQLPIAVKHVLQSKATDAQRKEAIVECRLQCELESPFVVKCFGFASYPGPGDFSILLELMDLGDLLSYMIKRTKANDRIAEGTRLQWMIQAASALEYLHECGLIHADVAARNLCLVHADDRIVCKLTDFGLSKRLNSDGIYWLPRGQPLPLWWTAPECLPVQSNFHSLPSSSSADNIQGLKLARANDVWSFGVTMWEIEAHATMPTVQRPFGHVAGGPGALGTLYNELMTHKAAALAFKFMGGIFDGPGTAFPGPSQIATMGCLRLREEERFNMSKVRQRLQACSICDAKAWGQEQVHQWLYQMGAPWDQQALGTDLFTSLTSFEELCSELIDDNYRGDYLDEKAHPGFSPELSRRILVELKGIQDLLAFKAHEGEGWSEKIAGARPEEFDWMSRYQAVPRSKKRRRRRNESDVTRLRDRNDTGSRLSDLYASESNSLYTTGTSAEALSWEGNSSDPTGVVDDKGESKAGGVSIEMQATLQGTAERKSQEVDVRLESAQERMQRTCSNPLRHDRRNQQQAKSSADAVTPV